MLLDDLTREQAQELARRELSRPDYAEAQPPLVVRLLDQVFEALGNAFDGASGAFPGGSSGLVLVLLVVLTAVVLVILRVRPTGGGAQTGSVFTGGRALTAADHRKRATAAAASGDFAEAVRERLRAVVRELEARGVLDARAGRTADEVAREAGRLVPVLAEPLRLAATTFDEVWYGGRPADAASYQALVDVDRTVTSTRLVLA